MSEAFPSSPPDAESHGGCGATVSAGPSLSTLPIPDAGNSGGKIIETDHSALSGTTAGSMFEPNDPGAGGAASIDTVAPSPPDREVSIPADPAAMRTNLAEGGGDPGGDTHAAAPPPPDQVGEGPASATPPDRFVPLDPDAPASAVSVTHDPDLRLLTTDGVCIRAVRRRGNRHCFLVPANPGELRLVSRTASPSQAGGPSWDDRRAPGVKVGEIVVWERRSRTLATGHLELAGLLGWLTLEGGGQRWTDGNAVLTLPASRRPVLLEVEVVATGTYEVGTATLAETGTSLPDAAPDRATAAGHSAARSTRTDGSMNETITQSA